MARTKGMRKGTKRMRRNSMKRGTKRVKRTKRTKRTKRMIGGSLDLDIKTKLDRLFIFPEGERDDKIKSGLASAVGQIGQDYLPLKEIELYNNVVDYTNQKFMDLNADGPPKIEIPEVYK